MDTFLYDKSTSWPTFKDILSAYHQCRLKKQSSNQQISFEVRLAQNILKLEKEIKSQTYTPSRSRCFILNQPKPREIFAAHFRDRIIHHLIVSELEDYWERRFIFSSFACRKNKGTHGAIRYLQKQVRSLSQGGHKDVYILKLDLCSFFVSFDRYLLKDLLLASSTNNVLSYLIEQTFTHDPRKNVFIDSTEEERLLIEPHKSWFNREAHEGLPIGNLTSQFGANVYLNALDHYIKRELKQKYYQRYVDDLSFLSTSKEDLLQLEFKINSWLMTHRKQSLNKDIVPKL
jgi:RNA-directed DNA polymerase